MIFTARKCNKELFAVKSFKSMAFTAEQSRQLQNLIQFYETWKEVSQQLARLPGGMYWKVVTH
jgi:hypothetical protein